ncbi:hypothetical protein GCM10009559_50820 [Pseudonocardia zijingensis]|uniref:Uncharacterized protein n=1 Tax=Pseudonocardia zijingensis TaxID=153376 RepID=A0ABP3YKJ3_9PSEU
MLAAEARLAAVPFHAAPVPDQERHDHRFGAITGEIDPGMRPLRDHGARFALRGTDQGEMVAR